MNDELLQHRVDRLERCQEQTEDRVMAVERTQSGLVEAVKGVKESVDNVANTICWGVKLVLGGMFMTGLGVLGYWLKTYI